jgi:hypothetical protein
MANISGLMIVLVYILLIFRSTAALELWEVELGEHELKSHFTKIMGVLNEDHCVLLKTIC